LDIWEHQPLKELLPTMGKTGKRKKPLDDGENLGELEPCKGTAWYELALRKEQW
jgi:hypothetical protein